MFSVECLNRFEITSLKIRLEQNNFAVLLTFLGPPFLDESYEFHEMVRASIKGLCCRECTNLWLWLYREKIIALFRKKIKKFFNLYSGRSSLETRRLLCVLHEILQFITNSRYPNLLYGGIRITFSVHLCWNLLWCGNHSVMGFFTFSREFCPIKVESSRFDFKAFCATALWSQRNGCFGGITIFWGRVVDLLRPVDSLQQVVNIRCLPVNWASCFDCYCVPNCGEHGTSRGDSDGSSGLTHIHLLWQFTISSHQTSPSHHIVWQSLLIQDNKL